MGDVTKPTPDDMMLDLAEALQWLEDWHHRTAAEGYGDIAMARHALRYLPGAIRRAMAAESRSDLQAFLAMLDRADIGHGIRDDFNPSGTGVQVEHEDDAQTITDWWFDDKGTLKEVHVCTD